MEKVKLVCLPYAGASSFVFSKWKGYLDSSIELYPIELSGRGRRSKEPLYDSLKGAVDDIYRIIAPDLDNFPFSFFGHSMGSVILYELYYKIIENGHKKPLHLFFSGRGAPNMDRKHKTIYNASFDELKDEIIGLGGSPPELFEDCEMVRFYVPIIRADYKMIETYEYIPKPVKLQCNITVFHGINDQTVDSDISEWKFHTDGQYNIYNFDGGHFFINDYMGNVVSIINKTLLEEIKEYRETDDWS